MVAVATDAPGFMGVYLEFVTDLVAGAARLPNMGYLSDVDWLIRHLVHRFLLIGGPRKGVPLGGHGFKPTEHGTIAMALYDEIVRETVGFEKVIGVAVKHLGTGNEASFNGDELFPTASVFKVPVIVELYRQARVR